MKIYIKKRLIVSNEYEGEIIYMPEEIENYKALRRCILENLYSLFQEYPFGLTELISLEDDCHTDSRTLNWNLVYLDQCGYIELDKSQECPPYISCTVAITAKGIDLVENKSRFNKLFPA
jgi:hypothetical protein